MNRKVAKAKILFCHVMEITALCLVDSTYEAYLKGNVSYRKFRRVNREVNETLEMLISIRRN